MKALKVILVLGGTYLGCLLASAILTFVCIGVTEGWGAGRTGTAMMWFLFAEAAVYAASAVLVYGILARMAVATGARIAIVIGYVIVLVLTWLFAAMMSAVIFNR